MKILCRAFLLSLVLSVCGNVLAADAVDVSADAVLSRIQKQDASMFILDVRTPEEYARGHVPGAVNIPFDKIDGRINELTASKDKDVVLYCHSGRRAAIAATTLKAKGFERLLHLDGDIMKWIRENRPTEK